MAKKYVTPSKLSVFLDNLKNTFATLTHKHTLSDITDYRVDTSLSPTSTNPVQNKVLDAEFDAIGEAMGALEQAIDGKSDSTHNHDSKYDAKGSASAVQTNLNAVSDTLDSHTKNADIHVTTTNKSNWNTAYSHSQATHARTDATKVEDSTTNGNIKINGTETNVYSHPNSGVTAGTYKSVTVNAQGHITAGTNPTTLAGYGITDAETKSDASAKLTEAKNYADSAATKVKNDLLNGAGGAYDTLKELGDLIVDNQDAIEALETIASGKADATHGHAIADVSGLQSALDGKAASSHGTHVSYSTTAPVMDGTASVGSASTVARSDHKHPTDTSRASKTDFDNHVADTTKHITSTERTNWNYAYSHSTSAHAPSNAEKNQNAFSNVKVGTTTIAADTTTDTLELVGSNVTITPDATNDKVTFSVADGTTSAKGVVQLTNSTSSTSTTTAATPNSVKSAYDLANTAKTNAATAQTKADSAYSLADSKVDSLSDLGITATATELNYMDGVTSSVQVQLDSKSNSGHTHSWNNLDDKPFGETEPVETIIAQGTIPSGEMLSTTASVQWLTLGNTYTVIFDGTTYSNLKCVDVMGLAGLGSADMSYTDYPFAFAIQNGTAMAFAGDTASHSITIIEYVADVIPLDRKYIAEYIDTLTGEKVTGKDYIVGSESVTAGKGAEIFNDYVNNIATGQYSHAEGMYTQATGMLSHAEGYNTKASGGYSHAEGNETNATGWYAHAEGAFTNATGEYSHAEGHGTTASGYYSHAQGGSTTASGNSAHAEGNGSVASGVNSHAEGECTTASSENQHVQGKYNVEDASGTYAHIVGNGANNSKRSNAHTLDWNGNAWFKGNVYVGGTSKDNASSLAVVKKITQAEYDALPDSKNSDGIIYAIIDG